jgi:hypothetical protein
MPEFSAQQALRRGHPLGASAEALGKIKSEKPAAMWAQCWGASFTSSFVTQRKRGPA